MLQGEAKRNYQREYMRRRRSNKKDVRPPVRPMLDPNITKHFGSIEAKNLSPDTITAIILERPEIDADGNPIYEQ